MCVHICDYVYLYIHVYMCLWVCVYVQVSICMCRYACICVYFYMHVCIYVCACICVCVQVCVSACMKSQTLLFFKSLLEITQTTSRSRFFSVGSSHFKKNDLVIQSLQFNETINTFLLVAWIGQASWVVHDVSLVSLACLCSVLHSPPLCPGFLRAEFRCHRLSYKTVC